jgi:glutamate N-acetyltransferase / amino-acid N-acetyltransferase
MSSATTFARGFRAAGIHCGIKKDGKRDLGIVASDEPAFAWALFTTNQVKGAPVIVSRSHLRSATTRAIVVNSGNANTVTKHSLQHAERMTRTVADALGCRPAQVLIAATGVIGQPMPIDKVLSGINTLVPQLSSDGGREFSEAILTTDTSVKESVATVRIGAREIRIGGCAKGAGMIHPSMATLLVFVTTDARIAKPVLRDMITRANDASFHRITIDGDTSTSDTMAIMANGASGAADIARASGSQYDKVLEGITSVCADLARQIVEDAEGASKFIAVRVGGAPDERKARQVAFAIARSSLVKTALFGEDANWGRILCAAGYAGVPLSVDKLTLRINGELIFRRGGLVDPGWEQRVAPTLKQRRITIDLGLGAGSSETEVWTSDLTNDYVRINAHYRS